MPNAFQDGYAFGKGAMDDLHQGIRRSKLASLASQAYGAAPQQRDQFVQQAVGVDPMAGLSIGKQLQVSEEERTQRLGVMARALVSVPEQMRPGLYRQMIPELSRFGLSELPPDYTPEVGQMAEKLHSVLSGAGQATPTGFQELHMKALAAGYQPGTPEYQRAMRVGIGTEGRAATGGFGFEVVKGDDGRERMGRTNPRTGQFEVYDETTGDFAPMGGGAPLNGSVAPSATMPAPTTGAGAAVLQGALQDTSPQAVQSLITSLAGRFGGQVTSLQRTPEHNARVRGVPNSQHIPGTAGDVVFRDPQAKAQYIAAARAAGLEVIDEGDHVHSELPRFAQSRPGIAVSQTPAEKVAAETAAREQVELGLLPTRGSIEAQNAAAKTEAEERARLGLLPMRNEIEAQGAGLRTGAENAAKAQAELAAKNATRARDSQASLVLLEEAKKILPQATGGRGGAAVDQGAAFFGKSTAGAQATARLKLLSAQLVAKVPRFEGPQSNIDVQFYREAAGDLANDLLPVATRMAALNQMIELNKKYAGQSDQEPSATRRGGSVDDLLSKYGIR